MLRVRMCECVEVDLTHLGSPTRNTPVHAEDRVSDDGRLREEKGIQEPFENTIDHGMCAKRKSSQQSLKRLGQATGWCTVRATQPTPHEYRQMSTAESKK
jgi:hypothetical protein